MLAGHRILSEPVEIVDDSLLIGLQGIQLSEEILEFYPEAPGVLKPAQTVDCLLELLFLVIHLLKLLQQLLCLVL